MLNRYLNGSPRAAGSRNSLLARGARGLPLAALAFGAAALGLVPGVAAAQRNRVTPESHVTELVREGSSERAVDGFDLGTRRRGFSLFASEDLALQGMRMTGTHGWFVNNIGPCPLYFTLDAEFCGATTRSNGTVDDPWFEIGFLAGAPISEARKIRQVWPGINLMQPPFGYTAPYTSYLVPPRIERWGPADGQFGTLFSGVTSTRDGSCRDNTSLFNGQIGTSLSVTLLAGSDCPETWPRTGFRGMNPLITDSLVANAALIKANGWDEWRFPARWRDTSQFIGNFTSYGTISDSYREQIQRYGGVTRLGAGAPSIAGYPLGLDIRFDAWQFARPSIRNVVYYLVTIVNNSERLYGAGIDYDSLYFGVQPGYLGGSGPQRGPWYFDFRRNAVIFAGGNTSGRCGATFPPQTVFVGGCINTLGFPGATGQAILTLKSPFGDMRNKLFSRTGAYNIPGDDPKKDDTITFNHAHMGGFGATYTNSFLVNDQVRFGYLSSQEDVFLAGRDPNSLSLVLLWSYFQNENWRTFGGAVRPDLLKFPRYVPSTTANTGLWDWNEDNIPDTISVPGCGSQGCAALYSDTVAAGFRSRMDNVGNLITTGPFPLGAGDTTQFLYAFIGHGDSTAFEAQINAAISTYLGNYAGPAAAPAPVFTAADVDVTSAAVRDSANGVQTALVRIRVTQPTVRPDPFINTVIQRLSEANPTAQRLNRLNPTLLATVQNRLSTNISEVLVFKSCDRGQTFTRGTGANCDPAPATGPNGSPIGFGWQPFARIGVDSTTGRYTSSVVQDIVQAGRTYLYSFVTRTRGLSDIPVVDSIGCRSGTGGSGQPACDVLIGTTNLAAAFNVDADTVASPLNRSGPNTVTVYAPISLPAGSSLARLDTLTVSGIGTARLTATARGSSITPGRYTVFFANRFVVFSRRNTATGAITQDSIVAERFITSAVLPGATEAQTNVVVDRRKFAGPSTVFIDGFTPTRSQGTTGGFERFQDTVRARGTGLGYILARADGAISTPFFVSDTTTATPARFEASSGFPGVVVGFVAEAAPRTSVTIRQPGDTLNQTIINRDAVTFQVLPDSTRPLGSVTGGTYVFTWSDDAWGPTAPFNFGPPTVLQPQVDASLSARRNVDSTRTDTSVLNALSRAGINTTRPLISARLPFTLRTPAGEPVRFAMFRRHATSADSIRANSRLLGTAGDTTRVSIPTDLWMPGDTLFVLERGFVTTTTGTAPVLKDTIIAGRTVRVPVRAIQELAPQRLLLGCTTQNNLSPGRNTCNPIALTTRGATSYFGYENGWQTIVEFARPFELFSEVQVTASPQVASARAITDVDLARIRVVPNPYVVQSSFDNINQQSRIGSPRVMFTNVPEQGVLRVYTVAGQFVQQVSWTRSDLQNLGTTTLTGDLPFTLLTREGLQMGPGLYLYVLTPTGSNSTGKVARGKFVIIR